MAAPVDLTGVDVSNGTFMLEGKPAYLAGAKDVFPHVEQLASQQGPAFDGDPDAFLASHEEKGGALQAQMKNKIRKCGQCGKVVAFTLASCNGCGSSMTSTPITYSNNIFTSFVYGIRKGPFPFTISVREQTQDYLVFDDLLQLTPCHLNAIPTTQYIPDWRYLLKDPVAGLEIVESLYMHLWTVAKNQFLSDATWKGKLLDPAVHSLSDSELQRFVAAGFNFPPSQFQLHMQFMVMPMTPIVHQQYLDGLHFTHGRFFPVEYVRKVLELNVPFDVSDDTDIQTIVDFYTSKGVDYDVIHGQCYKRYGDTHVAAACWDAKDFTAVVVDGKEVRSLSSDGPTEPDPKVLQNKDKLVLQNYGRPYSAEGRPQGSYYTHAKQPGALRAW